MLIIRHVRACLCKAEATKSDAQRGHRTSGERHSGVEGASDDGGPTDVEGASDGGYSAMDGGSEYTSDSAAAGMSWPARWHGFGRSSSAESGGKPPAANGQHQTENGHVENGKHPTLEATARQLASKGLQAVSPVPSLPVHLKTAVDCAYLPCTYMCRCMARYDDHVDL